MNVTPSIWALESPASENCPKRTSRTAVREKDDPVTHHRSTGLVVRAVAENGKVKMGPPWSPVCMALFSVDQFSASAEFFGQRPVVLSQPTMSELSG